MDRAIVEAVTDLKARELCTSGEAFRVIQETRGLLKLHDEVKKIIPQAPDVPLSHLRVFAESMQEISEIKLRYELAKQLPAERLGGDSLYAYSVGEFCPSPTHSGTSKSFSYMWKLDYELIYSRYLSSRVRGAEDQEAFIEAVSMIAAAPVFIGEDGATYTLDEAVSFMEDLEKNQSPDETAVIPKEQELEHLEDSLESAIEAYNPSAGGPPQTRLEINFRQLYKRGRNEYTLGAEEVEKKIALNLMRSAIQLEREGGVDSPNLEIVFEKALKRERDAVSKRRARMPHLGGGIPQYAESLAEAQYYVKILQENKSWLLDALSR